MSDRQPICERCWALEEGRWTALDDPDGPPGKVRVPPRAVRDPREAPESCAWCGWPTWAGIFWRALADPGAPVAPAGGQAQVP